MARGEALARGRVGYWAWYSLRWLEAFAFTELVEAPLYRRALGLPWWRCLAASALTHPVVWFGFFHPALRLPRAEATALAEAFAVLVEALWLARRAPPLRALAVSLGANAASLALGLASRALTGHP